MVSTICSNLQSTCLLKRMTILLLVAFLMGCGSQQVIVDGNYPKPLIKSLPLKLALVLNSDFLEHEYHYQPKEFRESKLTIKSGISQGKMINTCLLYTSDAADE